MQVSQGLLQGWRLHSFPEEPVPVSHHPRGKAFSLMSDWDFPCFDLCPLSPVLLLCLAGKSLAVSSLSLPTRLSVASVRSPFTWNLSCEMGLSFRLLGVEQSTEVTNYFGSVWLKQLSGDSLIPCVAFRNLSSSH